MEFIEVRSMSEKNVLGRKTLYRNFRKKMLTIIMAV